MSDDQGGPDQRVGIGTARGVESRTEHHLVRSKRANSPLTAHIDSAPIDPLDLVDPARFAANGYPEAAWARLRAEAPIAHFAPPGYDPFWAVTKHADVAEVTSQPVRFSNEHGLVLGPLGAPSQPMEMVVTMDPPRHGPLRRVGMRHFTPRSIRSRHAEIDRITTEILDQAATGADSASFDFVERIAAPLPIAVISWFLDVPREDWPLLFRWTNEIIGKDDPEFGGRARRRPRPSGVHAANSTAT